METTNKQSAASGTERNDCTVRAFAAFASVPYPMAHAACSEHGRKSRRRFRRFNLAVPGIASTLGVSVRQVARSGTVRALLLRFPTGALLVRVSGHAFAIRDGATFDNLVTRPRCIVKQAWLLLPQCEILSVR